MATVTDERHLSNLIINKVPDQDTFQAMQNAGQINSDELYFVVEEEGISYSLARNGDMIRLLNNGNLVNEVSINNPTSAGSVGHTLTIGTYTFNGSADVSIPIYDGTYS